MKYYFTFGWGQVHQNCYHVIEADSSLAALEIMTNRFGNTFALQYESSEKAGVDRFNLTEVV